MIGSVPVSSVVGSGHINVRPFPLRAPRITAPTIAVPRTDRAADHYTVLRRNSRVDETHSNAVRVRTAPTASVAYVASTAPTASTTTTFVAAALHHAAAKEEVHDRREEVRRRHASAATVSRLL